MNKILFYFSLFIIYAVMGWIIEVISVSIRTKKLSNRGFLIGPYCPIYGVSALTMILCLTKYKNDIVVLFLMSFIICSTLEYLTSLFMEKAFKARWWDYTGRVLNVDGRVCLFNSIAFGILGVLLIYYVNPFVLKLIDILPVFLFRSITCFILVLFITDCVISFNVIFKLNKATEVLRKDYTDEIAEKVKEKIKQNSKLAKRILNAFPNYRIINKIKK